MLKWFKNRRAQKEAQKMHRGWADQEFERIKMHVKLFLEGRGIAMIGNSGVYFAFFPGSEDLKNLKTLYEHSDYGSAKFLEISKVFTSLAENIESELAEFGSDSVRSHNGIYGCPKENAQDLIRNLRVSSEIFYKRAAKPTVMR